MIGVGGPDMAPPTLGASREKPVTLLDIPQRGSGAGTLFLIGDSERRYTMIASTSSRAIPPA